MSVHYWSCCNNDVYNYCREVIRLSFFEFYECYVDTAKKHSTKLDDTSMYMLDS